jgi:hypothetical protein
MTMTKLGLTVAIGAGNGIKTDDWHWERIAITDQVRAAYQKQYDYWKNNEEVVANLPDRPAAAGAQPQ